MATQADKREKVLGRVRKLLAMVHGNATENEVAIASVQAQKLIEKYRLEEAELNTATGSASYQKQVLVDEHRTSIEDWKIYLAVVLSEHNGCRVLARKGVAVDGTPARITIVGKEENIKTTQYLFQTIGTAIERLCEEKRKLDTDFGKLRGSDAFNSKLAAHLLTRVLEYGSTRDKGEEWANAFRNGAIDRIDTRLKNAREDAREEVQASDKALAIVDSEVDKVLEYIQENMRVGQDVNVNNDVNRMDGYREGLRAGSRIDLGLDSGELPSSKNQINSDEK